MSKEGLRYAACMELVEENVLTVSIWVLTRYGLPQSWLEMEVNRAQTLYESVISIAGSVNLMQDV
jgi:hypothetical protein